MPRPKNTVPTARKTIHIDENVAARVDLLLLEPSRAKPKFGAWSKLCEKLLRQWVADQVVKPKEVGERNPYPNDDLNRKENNDEAHLPETL